MSIESLLPPSLTRLSWPRALLASVPCYVRRLVVVFVIVPAAVPGIGLALLNHGSFTGMARTLLEQAAASGTNPDTIRLQSCADPLVHLPRSPICTHWRTDDVPIQTLAPQLGHGLFAVWLVTAIIMLATDLGKSPSSPLALRERLNTIGRRRTERSRATVEGDAK
ncbi:hypothetical protein G3N57_00345 [Paraburkholderia sp. Se-20369]|nr:hypothetical protein [Paraburkholderia sp. Se-20369]